MGYSEQADLEFYPDAVSRQRGCYLSPVRIVLLVLAFVACLLIVGLSVGLTRPSSNQRETTTAMMSTTGAPPATSTGAPPGGDKSYRLPRAVYPLHYEIEMRPDLDPARFTFDGNVTITVNCTSDTSNITMNMDGLEMQAIHMLGPDGDVDIDSHEVDRRRFFLIVHFKESLKAGEQYNLSMSFTGKLQNNLIGIYWGSYKDAEMNVKYFAATQFESTRARRALPCFDEPLFKAEFTVTLLRRSHHNCLSNMPSVSVEARENGWVAESFAKSVPMPTYLLAMYVGDLRYRNISSSLPIQMRVWTRADGISKTDYASEVAAKQMAGFQTYFNISYALPKMDHVGLPEMGPGAMENYGLIKYRDKFVIVANDVSPEAKQSAAFIFAHELGHQWFGNLVTMVWWDDIWLNEGFANLCEYIGVEFVHPEWKPWEQFIYRTLHQAMILDSLRNSRVIRQDANTPDEISANFDAISYRKGSSIVRMLRDVMGHDTFKRGITRYLNRYRFKNTVSDDLWQALSEQAKEEGNELNVTRVMHTWTLQMNYPLVTVTRDYEAENAIFTQSRFLLDTHGDTEDQDGAKTKFNFRWEIPITLLNQAEDDWDSPNRKWMTGSNETLTGVAPSDKWLLVNIRRTGLYRVNYDDRNWGSLYEQLMQNHTVLPTENRAQLIDDSFQLARAVVLSQETALNMTRFLSNERDLVPWKTAELIFSFMYEILAQTKAYGGFQRYIIQIITPALNDLGWEDRGEHLERMLRTTLVRLACLFEDQSCVSNATYYFNQWMANPESNVIPVSIRQTVYCAAIRAGGEQEWNFAWQQFRKLTDPVHRSALRDAMTCSGQPWLLSRYLEWASDTSRIKRGESSNVLIGIAKNPIGRPLFWRKIQQQWSGTGGKAVFGKKAIASEGFNGFYTKVDVEELEAFRDKYINDHANAKRLVFAAVEKAWVSYRWIDSNLEKMLKWFKETTGVPIPSIHE